jgi:hypothetical protein
VALVRTPQEERLGLVFTKDHVFQSPSAAAIVVLGRSANGRDEWKDNQGRTLKWLQETGRDESADGK